MILLDTCAILWLAEGSRRISSETIAMIDREAVVAVSAMSAFEIALKCRKGKLSLPMSPEKWWNQVIDHHRLDVIELSPSVAMRATRLPGIHKDPADRFIIASALELNSSVVTGDGRFGKYGIRVLQ